MGAAPRSDHLIAAANEVVDEQKRGLRCLQEDGECARGCHDVFFGDGEDLACLTGEQKSAVGRVGNLAFDVGDEERVEEIAPQLSGVRKVASGVDDGCAEALDGAIEHGIDKWFIVIEKDVEKIEGERAFV